MSLMDTLKGLVAPQAQQPPLVNEEGELFRLLAECHRESQLSRRYEVRRIMRARSYYKGHQHIWWNEKRGEFSTRTRDVGPQLDQGDNDQESSFQYTINIFRSTGHSLIAVLSGTLPVVRFFPKNAEKTEDVKTARAANDILELAYRQNDARGKAAEKSFYFYTDGLCGVYVRYVVDGERFGYREEPITETVPVQIGDQETVVPRVTGTRKVPNGGVITTTVGGLELRVPPDSRDEYDYEYLTWSTEVDLSKLKAMYPEVANKLREQPSVGNTDDEQERFWRMSLKAKTGAVGTLVPTDMQGKKVTFTRAWFRPSAFHRIGNEEFKAQLLQEYQDGLMVAFAGNVLCEKRNESMLDHWVVEHALPGDGQVRESLGDSIIETQDITNDLINMEVDAARQAVSTIFADDRALNTDAFANTLIEPGRIYPVTRQTDDPIGAHFFSLDPAQISPQVTALRQEVSGKLTEGLSGALPAMIGGEMDSQRTASGYRMARDQALGRLGLPWRGLTRMAVKEARLIVLNYQRYQTQDVSFPDQNAAGFKNKTISVDDLKGEVEVYAESDEAFPISPTDKRAVISAYMLSPDPVYHGAVISPENFDVVKGIQGVPELVLPGQRAREKQLREIDLLLQGQPQQDPMTGQMISTVPVGMLDNHQAHLQTLQFWSETELAEQMAQQNPMGYQNVLAHAQEHQFALNPPPPVPPPPGAPGGQAGTSVGPPEGAPTGQPDSNEPALQPEQQQAPPPSAQGGFGQ